MFARYTLSGKNCRRCVAFEHSFLHTRTRGLLQYNMPMYSHSIYTYKFCFCVLYLPVPLYSPSPPPRAISISGTVVVLFISGNELKDFLSSIYQIFRRVPCSILPSSAYNSMTVTTKTYKVAHAIHIYINTQNVPQS